MSFYAKSSPDVHPPRPENAPPGFAGVVSGYRYYDAELGRWLNRDPAEEGGGLNLYDYQLKGPHQGFEFLGLFSADEIKPHLGPRFGFAVEWMNNNGHTFEAKSFWFRRYKGGEKYARFDCNITDRDEAVKAAAEALRQWARAGRRDYFPEVAKAYATRSGAGSAPQVMGDTFDFVHLFSKYPSPNQEGLNSSHVSDAYRWVFVGSHNRSATGPWPVPLGDLGNRRWRDPVWPTGDQSHHFAAFFDLGHDHGSDRALRRGLRRTGDLPRSNNSADFDLGVLGYDLGKEYETLKNFIGARIMSLIQSGVEPSTTRMRAIDSSIP